jgi:predicted RNase H-like HicB family nuclease
MEKFNILIETDEEGWFTSEVVELPGCHTQAKTLEELMKRTKEAILLYLKCQKSEDRIKFFKLKQIEV